MIEVADYLCRRVRDTDVIPIVGIAWFREAAWEQLQDIPEVRSKLSYAEYLMYLEECEQEFAAHGIKTVAVPIDNIDWMLEWCTHNGYKIDSKGRGLNCIIPLMPVIDATRH
jgi:hypothetical protein